jgi:hypothetical protein
MTLTRTNLALAVCMLGSVLLAGCSDTQGDVGNRNIRPNSVLVDGNGNRVIDKRFANDQFNEMNRVYGRRLNSNNLIGRHQNYRMEISQDIAERLNAINGIESSCVILTDSNAYVAIQSADAKRNGSQSRSDTSTNKSRGIGTNSTGSLGYPRMYEAADIERDTNPLEHGMGMQSSRTESRAGIEPTPGNAGAGSRYQSLQAKGNLRQQAAAVIQSMAPQIERVYVSQDPEFYSRLSSYVAEASSGKPIQGYIAEFNAMVERLFPMKSGIRTSRSTDTSPFD